jgi:hypothetical protein
MTTRKAKAEATARDSADSLRGMANEKRSAWKRGLATVVGGGFGVDEDAGYLGVVEAEFAFEVGDDGVNGLHGHVVGEGDVAVDLDGVGGAAVAAGEGDFVDVEDVGEVAGGGAELAFQILAGVYLGGDGDGGGFAFNVGEECGDAGDFAAHVGF